MANIFINGINAIAHKSTCQSSTRQRNEVLRVMSPNPWLLLLSFNICFTFICLYNFWTFESICTIAISLPIGRDNKIYLILYYLDPIVTHGTSNWLIGQIKILWYCVFNSWICLK